MVDFRRDISSIRIDLKKIFWALSVGLILLVSWLVTDYGVTWDEWMDSNNGLLTLRYILTLGRDTSYTQLGHGYLYPSLFFSLVGTVFGLLSGDLHAFVFGGYHQDQHLLPFFQVSHWINALFGCAAVILTGLLTKLVAGWRAAILAFLFMALSPRFFGASFNDPKDISMAAGYIASLYFILRLLTEQPSPRLFTRCFLAISIAITIGASAGGLILFPYLFLFSVLYWISSPSPQRASLKNLLSNLFIISFAGYIGGLFFWPYGQQNLFINPIAGLAKLSSFNFWDSTILFEGKALKNEQLPWYYLLKWIFISVPFFIHFGIALFILRIRLLSERFDWRLLGMVIFSFAFPLGYQIISKGTVMDGWRHFYFIYPPIVVIAAVAWDGFWTDCSQPLHRFFLAAPLGVLLLMPLQWMIRNHPHQYIYFNESTGGLRGALGNYETDYWGNSLRGCAEWLGRHQSAKSPLQKTVVRADGNIMSTYPFLRKALGKAYIQYGYPDDFIHQNPYFFISYPPLNYPGQDWDYGIVMTRGSDPALLRQRQWPQAPVLYEVRADDTPLCAVVKNPSREA